MRLGYHILTTLLLSGMLALPQMVELEARALGLDVDRVLRVVELESAWDPNAIGDEGEAVGLWQFHAGTWTWLCDLTGHSEWRDPLLRRNPVYATIVALEAIQMGYGSHWTAWRITENLY